MIHDFTHTRKLYLDDIICQEEGKRQRNLINDKRNITRYCMMMMMCCLCSSVKSTCNFFNSKYSRPYSHQQQQY